MSGNALNIEQARIITISTAHLSAGTMDGIELFAGELPEGPSIAIREAGFLVNSHLGDEGALAQDCAAGRHPALLERYPDLVLIRALARGLGAEWINLDRDGIEYSDLLPTYDDEGVASTPTADGWRDALSGVGTNFLGKAMVIPDRATLEIIEAGQTPGLDDAPAP